MTNSVTDDGTGHLDMYLKILDDDRILVGEYSEPFDNAEQQLNAGRLDDNADFLEAYVKPDGTTFTVERLPMPGHRSSSLGEIPFTYINSTFFNGVNLWPATSYDDWRASRDAAQATWEAVLPDMEHVWIDATELSFYSGAIHCVTRTIPAVEAGDWVADGSCGGQTCVAPEGGYTGRCVPGADGADACFGPEWLCGCNDCDGGCVTPEDPCEGVTYLGCCEGSTLSYCEAQQLYQVACEDSCGWDGASGFYNCGSSGEDPTGDHPRACGGAGCAIDCADRVCGDDGCGGSCGECSGDNLCVAGTCRSDCEDCTPGEIGCSGDVAWLCTEGEGGCNQHHTVDCSVTGRTCDGGDCVEPVAEPEPDVIESDTSPAPDATADGDVGPSPGDSSLGGDGATNDVSAIDGDVPIGRIVSGGGCAAGDATGPPWALLLAAGVLNALRRRRRPRGVAA